MNGLLRDDVFQEVRSRHILSQRCVMVVLEIGHGWHSYRVDKHLGLAIAKQALAL